MTGGLEFRKLAPRVIEGCVNLIASTFATATVASVGRKVVREKEIIIHQPPAARGSVEEGGEDDGADGGEDDGDLYADYIEICQDHDGHEKADNGHAIIQRHRAKEEALVVLAFKCEVAAVATGVDPEEGIAAKKRRGGAVGTAMSQPAGDDLGTGDSHKKKRSTRGESSAVAMRTWRCLGTELVAHKAAHDDILPDLGDLIGQKVLHRFVRIFDEGLVEEADRGVMLVEFTFHNLLDGGGRFTGDLSDGDLTLFGQFSLWDRISRNVKRAGGGDLEAEVLNEGFEAIVAADEIGFAINLDEDADFSTDVDVASDDAFSRNARGEFIEFGTKFFAEKSDGVVDAAVGLGEGFFTLE
jgi:hypothetical protein